MMSRHPMAAVAALEKESGHRTQKEAARALVRFLGGPARAYFFLRSAASRIERNSLPVFHSGYFAAWATR